MTTLTTAIMDMPVKNMMSAIHSLFLSLFFLSEEYEMRADTVKMNASIARFLSA